MQKNEHFLKGLSRFIKGSNAPEDQAAFEALFKHYKKQNKDRTRLSPYEEEQLGKELFRKIQYSINDMNTKSKEHVQVRALAIKRAWLVAASIALVMALAVASYSWIPATKQMILAMIEIEQSAPAGETTQYELPDGTLVKLNAGSKIIYPRFFLGNSREVDLSGEVFFKVTRNVEKPFIIHSGEVVTRVLGTSFNIRAYEKSRHTTVTVVTGKVEVSYRGNVLSTLTPNEEITIESNSGSFTMLGNIDTGTRLAWEERRLIFNNMSLDEVIIVLSNFYNIEIVSNVPDLQMDRITAEFAPGTPYDQVFKTLSIVNKLDIFKNNNQFIISRKF